MVFLFAFLGALLGFLGCLFAFLVALLGFLGCLCVVLRLFRE